MKSKEEARWFKETEQNGAYYTTVELENPSYSLSDLQYQYFYPCSDFD